MAKKLANFVQWLKDSWKELKRVTWPTKDDVIATTIAVIVLTVVFSAAIYASDKVISTVVEYIYRVLGT
ncbi:preprotein translocase subunit SecE [Thermotomaculum hydrothermale]|uniref:Protein translocase subunit SecE n=1 Tax=Thermotomaculum hydrothermale TaxID=981385 RepID=A0A7R6PFT8_9BACT|nr:preprotein translocase subunit SecE [Thermotomaculum hydrothermale]BBB32943.1 preprotein translocase subunit SecE [Thermotomaculum hydrothermale]